MGRSEFLAEPMTGPRTQAESSGPGHSDLFVEVDHVVFGYDSGRTILNDVSLQFGRGKVTAIMGGSGCGKTTLLRLIGGQLRASKGRVMVDGQDVGTLDADAMYAMRRKMGMLFQFGALFTDMTVFDNVAFQLREHTDLPEDMIRDLVLMKLDAVGLRGTAKLLPSELSGGMARRVALARAMALDPMLIMYDEPFAGLDPISLAVGARLSAAQQCAGRHLHRGDTRHRESLQDRRLHLLRVAAGASVARARRPRCAGPTEPVRASVRPTASPTARCRSTTRRARSPRTSGSARHDAHSLRGSAAARSRSVASRLRHDVLPRRAARLPGGAAPAISRRRADPRFGNLSLVIILASGLAVGFVLALQMYYALVTYGATESLGLIVNLSLTRELGPVVTALLFAGRAGTSLTAEIGLMKAGEQLAAMDMMAVDPKSRVLAPRFIAGVISMPILAILFSSIGSSAPMSSPCCLSASTPAISGRSCSLASTSGETSATASSRASSSD